MFNRHFVVPLALGGMLAAPAFASGDTVVWVESVMLALALLIVAFSSGVRLLGSDWRDPARWFGLFLLASAVSIIWSQDTYSSLRAYSYLFAGFAVYLGVRQLLVQHQKKLLQVLVVIISLEALWALVEQVHQHLSRAEGLLGNANALGALLGIGLPLTMLVAWQSTGWRRWLYWVIVLVVGVALLSSFSLTAIAGLIVASVITVAVYAGRRGISRRTVIVGLAGSIFLVLLIVGIRTVQSGNIQDGIRLDKVITREHLDSSFGQRTLFNLSSLLMLAERPLVGIGLGNFQLAYPRFALSLHEQPRYAHNAYLEFFAEGGVAVGLLFLVLINFLIRQATLKTRDPGEQTLVLPLLLLALLSGALAAMVDFGWHFPLVWLTFWVVAGLLAEPLVITQKVGNRISWGFLTLFGVVLCVMSFGRVLAQQYFDRGERLLQSGSTSDAITVFDKGLRTDPQPRVRGRLAVALWIEAQGDAAMLQRAQVELEKNVQVSPTDYFTYHILGRVLASAKKFEQADAAFQLALKYSRFFHPEIQWEYANFLISQKHFVAARAVTEDVLNAYRNTAWSANPNIKVILEAIRSQQSRYMQ